MRQPIEVNRARFANICYEFNLAEHDRSGIGTYMEKRVHQALKKYFEPDECCHEVKFKGYVCDIKNDRGIFEIQTGNFGNLRGKLEAFLPECEVTVIYPVAKTRRLIWLDPSSGEIVSNRKSPKIGQPSSIMNELVYMRGFMEQRRLHYCIPMLDVDEYRLLDGWSRDKKRGSHRHDLVPVALDDIIELNAPEDFARFIPDELGDSFTIREYAAATKKTYTEAQRAIRILSDTKNVFDTEKRGRQKQFKRAEYAIIDE